LGRLRKVPHIIYLYNISNEEGLKRARSTRLQDIVAERRLRVAGHSYVFPIIGIPRPQLDGHQPEEHIEEVVQR